KPSESYRAEYVSGNYFSTFGIPAYKGRMIAPQDDNKGAPLTAGMSHRPRRTKIGRDPRGWGAGVFINSQPGMVVGIAPPGFFGDRIQSNPPAFWLPLNSEPVVEPAIAVLDAAELDWLDLIGRVSPKADKKAMEAQMQVELRQFLLSPESKVEERSKSLVPKQTLHFSPGGGGIQQLREEAQDGL